MADFDALSHEEAIRLLKEFAKEKETLNEEKDSLLKEVEHLKAQVEVEQLRNTSLQNELKQKMVAMQAIAEQEEEYVTNMLFKKIDALKKEKENLIIQLEREEEFLTNTMQKKLAQLQKEKVDLENTLEQEQEFLVNRLQRKMKELENSTHDLQKKLHQMSQEKAALENAMEAEQEYIVNRLQRKMEQLEADKGYLEEKLQKSPRSSATVVERLKQEVGVLRNSLKENQHKQSVRLQEYLHDQHQLREENLRLRQRVMREMEIISSLTTEKFRAESDMEIDKERMYNLASARLPSPEVAAATLADQRQRSASLPSLKWWSKRSHPASPSLKSQKMDGEEG
eukprot:Colp12_sorted_trinity150504_noHs@14661